MILCILIVFLHIHPRCIAAFTEPLSKSYPGSPEPGLDGSFMAGSSEIG